MLKQKKDLELAKYAINMNWKTFNELYETRQKEENNFNTFIEKSTKEKLNEEKEFIKLFAHTISDAYDQFVKQHKYEFEALNSNFVIDFDDAAIFHDNSGWANFWVQSLKPTLFNPNTGPFKNIPIQAVFFEIKWSKGKVIENKIERTVIHFEIFGWFHPYKWGGRNKVDYATIGKITFTGFKRIISEIIELSDNNFITKINFEFKTWFYKCLGYYFL